MTGPIERMVFQMRLRATQDEGQGWIFTTEEEELDEGQGFAYTIPMESEQDDWRRHSYRFPGVKEEQYTEFDGKVDGDHLVVSVGDVRVRFAPLTDFFLPAPNAAPGTPPSPYEPIPYVGTREDLLSNFKLFLPIYALDLVEVDALYAKKILLIGLTPNFRSNV